MKKINYKIGDIIIINKIPLTWSGLLSDKGPFDIKIKYPYQCKIVNISQGISHKGIVDNNVTR